MSQAPRHNEESFCSMVLLMGTTGSGKSFFINKLKEDATTVGTDLYSCKLSFDISFFTI